MSDDGALARPGSWLRELARLKPAAWPWGLSIRSAFCVGTPFAVGIAADAVLTGMWVSLGTLMFAAGERSGPYRARFRQLAISAPIGATGYFAGYLAALPWPGTIAAISALAFLGGILSSYGAAFSVGAMQALLLASIAIGVPAIAPFWEPALLYLVGAVFYAAVLGVEALLRRRRPEREMTAGVVQALATLATACADRPDTDASGIEGFRRDVTDRLGGAYAALLDVRYRASGRDAGTDRMAAILQACDTLFARILSATDAEDLRLTADRLIGRAQHIAGGMGVVDDPDPRFHPRLAPAAPSLLQAVDALDVALRGDGGPPATGPVRSGGVRAALLLDRLAPGREAILSALALALCIAVAYATHLVNRENHWFWVPLTVGLIMKPDFGSVFARAVLRCAGTLGGVVIGAALIAVVPKGMPFVAAMMALAALLPWAMLRSYALQAVVLTPLVLLLVDIIIPGTADIDYAMQRLADTLVGAAIVLVFGFFIWPQTHVRELGQAFHAAMGAIAAYLRAAMAATSNGSDPAMDPDLARHRRAAYGHLADIRTRLQKSMAEPPPSGSEASAWFPLISAAERICDLITIYSTAAHGETGTAQDEALNGLVRLIAETPGGSAPETVAFPAGAADTPRAHLIAGVSAELAHMMRLSGPART